MSRKIVILSFMLAVFLVFSAGCISIGGDNNELEKSLISTITGQEITDEQMEKIKELADVVGDGDGELGVSDIIAMSQKKFTDEELAVLEQQGLLTEDGSLDYAAALGKLSSGELSEAELAYLKGAMNS